VRLVERNWSDYALMLGTNGSTKQWETSAGETASYMKRLSPTHPNRTVLLNGP
jgi:hypothetical protein